MQPLHGLFATADLLFIFTKRSGLYVSMTAVCMYDICFIVVCLCTQWCVVFLTSVLYDFYLCAGFLWSGKVREY